jgi:uracil-DNA glycosylase
MKINLSDLPHDWWMALISRPNVPSLEKISKFLDEQKTIICPPVDKVFEAFYWVELENVRVVILGQDPYVGLNQANGMAFSVPDGMAIPPTLKNIYKELASDLNVPKASHGDLSYWASQGVLLLNSVLTTELDKSGAHRGEGWEPFTEAVVQMLNAENTPMVFVLWGKWAESMERHLWNPKHLILKAAHPSPLSASKGFFDSKPFSKINKFLIDNGQEPIDWNLE